MHLRTYTHTYVRTHACGVVHVGVTYIVQWDWSIVVTVVQGSQPPLVGSETMRLTLFAWQIYKWLLKPLQEAYCIAPVWTGSHVGRSHMWRGGPYTLLCPRAFFTCEYMWMWIYVCVCVIVYVCILYYLYVTLCVCMLTCVCVWYCLYVYVCVYMCMSLYMCACVHACACLRLSFV